MLQHSCDIKIVRRVEIVEKIVARKQINRKPVAVRLYFKIIKNFLIQF